MAQCLECGRGLGAANQCKGCGWTKPRPPLAVVRPTPEPDPWRHETPLPPEVTARYLAELRAIRTRGDVTGRLRGCACDKCVAYFAKQDPEPAWITNP